MLDDHRLHIEKQFSALLKLRINTSNSLEEKDNTDTCEFELHQWIKQLMKLIYQRIPNEVLGLNSSKILKEELSHKNLFLLLRREQKKDSLEELLQDIHSLMYLLISMMDRITMLTQVKSPSKSQHHKLFKRRADKLGQ